MQKELSEITEMYSQGMNSNDSQTDSRLTVADILSSMASGETQVPTTFASVEGFSTGIPTRTTPTLTPTTLRNIEQAFMEQQYVLPLPETHQHQAGFVPPVVHANSAPQTTNYQNGVVVKEEKLWYTLPPQTTTTSSSKNNVTPTTRSVSGTVTKPSGRNMGGRRPNRDDKLSPEEEERRRVRRERNKLAAARCRKRRMDHTNMLLNETDGLEEKKQSLQSEIDLLKSQKDQLEFILEAHKCICKIAKLNGSAANNNNHDLKVTVSGESLIVPTSSTVPTSSYSTTAVPRTKPLVRPTTLSLHPTFAVPSSTSLKLNTSVSVSEATGISISTPSNGMFNFDALMEGGTGLTPVSTGLTPVIPTCSSQQRSSSSDLSSPDTINPKLVSL